jgi:hypothetical protein
LYQHWFLKSIVAKKYLEERTITELQFSYAAKKCNKLLKEASSCLCNEPAGTPEKVRISKE